MRPSLLFLSQCLPYPPHSGVTNRTFNVLKELAGDFDITLVAFSRRNHQKDDAEVADGVLHLRELGLNVLAPVRLRSERGVGAKAVVHAMALTAQVPYTFFDYGSRQYGEGLRRLLSTKRFDLVHMDSLDLYRWMNLVTGIPLACTHHSIESDLLRMRADQLGSIPVGWYVREQARKVERVERSLCPRVGLNVMMSSTDEAKLLALAPGARTLVIPNGVDTQYFSPLPAVSTTPGRVVFLGPSYMFPNRDGIEYFLSQIWPKIRSDRPGATFVVVGKIPPEHRDAFERETGVTCTGYVPDVRPYLAEAACCVVPLRVGGGTRLKILDAWAMGRAMVSTPVGCEGLDAVDGDNIIVRDEAAGFAGAVVQVLLDTDLNDRLGAAGRRTVMEQYSWEVVCAPLRLAYNRLCRERQ